MVVHVVGSTCTWYLCRQDEGAKKASVTACLSGLRDHLVGCTLPVLPQMWIHFKRDIIPWGACTCIMYFVQLYCKIVIDINIIIELLCCCWSSFSPSSVITSDEALNEKGNEERVRYLIIPLFWTCILISLSLSSLYMCTLM